MQLNNWNPDRITGRIFPILPNIPGRIFGSMWWLNPGWVPCPHHSPTRLDRWEKILKKGLWVEIRAIMLPSTIAGKKISSVYCQLNPCRKMRNRTKSYNNFLPPFFLGLMSLLNSLASPPSSGGRRGMGVADSLSHMSMGCRRIPAPLWFCGLAGP